MHYEAPIRGAVRHFLAEGGEFFRATGDGDVILEWKSEDASEETLLRDGAPIVSLFCRERRWMWQVMDGTSAPIRAGSRAEARQLATFYARRHAA
ncbi:hypothetical protein ABLE93_09455 [Xanthobacter sp. KR7-65]|uniref:hypothetical protein n=1 Tax=Xanthobacter sp. KR7-65 TaxID=3156612 RepID=UPI0032B36E59